MVAVPTHFYKVILMERPSKAPDSKRSYACGAFVMPNAPIDPATPLEAFAVPLTQLESVSGARARGLPAPCHAETLAQAHRIRRRAPEWRPAPVRPRVAAGLKFFPGLLTDDKRQSLDQAVSSSLPGTASVSPAQMRLATPADSSAAAPSSSAPAATALLGAWESQKPWCVSSGRQRLCARLAWRPSAP